MQISEFKVFFCMSFRLLFEGKWTRFKFRRDLIVCVFTFQADQLLAVGLSKQYQPMRPRKQEINFKKCPHRKVFILIRRKAKRRNDKTKGILDKEKERKEMEKSEKYPLRRYSFN